MQLSILTFAGKRKDIDLFQLKGNLNLNKKYFFYLKHFEIRNVTKFSILTSLSFCIDVNSNPF